ncbi:MAG TPA: hydantoinase/oxoprolinase family protein [Hyphomicrobiaceae bacterium]|nr:hydantoinase/oxoprolinase family protein [Hyphomicrobiaceae bacterium]
MSWRIGVDIGGTFADFCALDSASGTLHTLKVLTTPDRPGAEIGQGLDQLARQYGIAAADVAGFVHGTTVGINTVIQRRGARLGLITTAGFEDVLELARLQMPDMYSLFCSRPDPLITRDCIIGVGERVRADGSIQIPLDERDVARAVSSLRSMGCAGIVVSYLNGYRNSAHERRTVTLLKQLAPDLFAFSAAEVWPVVREYERTTTAILNAYVHPRVAGYLDALEGELSSRGAPAAAMITKSNGGMMSARLGRRDCVGMLLSGTASGVMGAAYVAKLAGVRNALTLDIGGTSADVAIIVDGEPQFGSGEKVGDFPLNIPSVSVTSIGDGGGSIASADSYGMLRVGPESAGSTPGPASYGRGGTRATLTDALVVTGYLGHAPLAYSAIKLDRAAAEHAIAPLAMAIGRTPVATADAIVEIAVSNMFVEVNKLIARFGVDPRDLTLVPFGGAGPMLGCLLAREIGIGQVMIPRRPGVVSALGALIADVKCDFIATVFSPVTAEAMPGLQAALAQLRQDGERWLFEQQGFKGAALVTLNADMRYVGQSFEIEVPIEERWIAEGDIEAIRLAFDRRHKEIYDFADEATDVAIVNLRLVIAGPTTKPELPSVGDGSGPPPPAATIEVWSEGAFHTIPLFHREALRHGHILPSPAVIAQEDTTSIIPAGFEGRIDRIGNIHLKRVN